MEIGIKKRRDPSENPPFILKNRNPARPKSRPNPMAHISAHFSLAQKPRDTSS